MSDIQASEIELDEIDHKRRSGGRGSVLTLGTVVGVLAATALTLFGVGAADNAVANFDSTSWLWSSGKGEVARVNGVTAKIDTRARVQDAQRHDVQISQSDRYLILRDMTTGQVSAMDLSTLQIDAVLPTTPGLGVSVQLHGEAAFVIDSVQGQVRQLDPHTLAPLGELLAFPPGITAGGFDGKGLLWVAVPSEGTVSAIQPGQKGARPTVARTVTVAPPNHELALSVLDSGVAVLDSTIGAVMRVQGDKVADTTTVPLEKSGALPARTVGLSIPVTVAEDRKVYIVGNEKVTEFTVPPGTGRIDPAVSFAGRIYVSDSTAGLVYEFDAAGKLVKKISINAAKGGLELDVREGHLFINAPDGSTARVVDDKHRVREVNKYDNGVLGGDPPPPPPPPKETNPPPPKKPPVNKPGKPPKVSASAGNATARVTWGKAKDNGAPVLRYVIEGGPKAITVAANQRAAQITGLTNGTTYKFTVHAVNSKGAGAKGAANPVIPTSDVPDPPLSITAKANPDGTVAVEWPAANGQGRQITRYDVTAISGGAATDLPDAKGTKLTVPAGTLEYGQQYAFQVIAINDRGASSKPSPLSATVVPFTAPGVPENATAATIADQKGALRVSWGAAEDNGRAITKYLVEAGGRTLETTATQMVVNGLGDDKSVQVKIRAVNEAGEGKAATATGRTIGIPAVTITRETAHYNSISVTLTPNSKGGVGTCKMEVANEGSVQVRCNTAPITITFRGLHPNNTYKYTMTITNAAGYTWVGRSKATSQLLFTVLCPGNNAECSRGVYAYTVPSNNNINSAVNPALRAGAQGTPQCFARGDTVNAKPYGAKESNIWLRFSYRGANAYFPYAWVRMDGGDDYNKIPAC